MTTSHFVAASRLIVLRARRRVFYDRAMPWAAALGLIVLYAIVGRFDSSFFF